MAGESKEAPTTSKIGGATFFPMMTPRPQYPSVRMWLYKVLVAYTRAPLLMALGAKALQGPFLAVVQALAARGLSERASFVAIAVAIRVLFYAVFNGVFEVAEHRGWLKEYRIAMKPAQRGSESLMRRTLTEALLGHALLGPLAMWFLFPLAKYCGMDPLAAQLPGLATLYAQFALAHFWNDFFFYWAHRSLHSEALYKIIHKQHHSWLATESVAAEFSHPVEQVFANFFPTLGGSLLFGRHPLMFFVWLMFRLEETYEAHSNFYFGNTWLAKIGLTHSENAAFHSHHHSRNAGNFGMWHMDYAFGTMDVYVAGGGEEGYIAERLGKDDKDL